MKASGLVRGCVLMLCGAVVWLHGLPMIARGAEQWGHHDLTLRAPGTGNPYLDVQLKATFTQGDPLASL